MLISCRKYGVLISCQSASGPFEAKCADISPSVLLCIVLVNRAFAFHAYYETTIIFSEKCGVTGSRNVYLDGNLMGTYPNEKDNRLFRAEFITTAVFPDSPFNLSEISYLTKCRFQSASNKYIYGTVTEHFFFSKMANFRQFEYVPLSFAHTLFQ